MLAVLLWAGVSSQALAQTHLWVSFTDKGFRAIEALAHPEAFLSEAALARRAKMGIAISRRDLPVSVCYTQELRRHSGRVVMTSRWFNAVLVEAARSDLAAIRSLPFVASVQPVLGHGMTLTAVTTTEEPAEPLSYGRSAFQLQMLGLPDFHERGFTGQNIRLAILDAGFPGVDTLAAFDSLRTRGGILATYDFVDDTSWVFHASAHGTRVLSTISTHLPDQIVGAAPMADVMLFRTEDARRETQIEEFHWVRAVETADSLGVDIIHSSLGYNKFQDSPGYVYEDMDGDKAIVTRAADWAAQRGILVVTSAGNEGRNSWRYITAPCDGDSILCVGSVTRWHDLSSFSSIGPTADGRIKPDVVAMGTSTTTVGPTPRIQLSNGTSFAAPIIAGFSACLMQAHPEASNMELIQAIRLSSDQAGLPDAEYGYGIPNIVHADSLLNTDEDLYSLTIAQRSKPPRGKQALEEAAQQVSPQAPGALGWTWDAYDLLIDLPNPTIRVSEVRIKRGEQFVTPNPEDIIKEGDHIRLKTARWLPGDYTITVDALEFNQMLTVSVPRA